MGYIWTTQNSFLFPKCISISINPTYDNQETHFFSYKSSLSSFTFSIQHHGNTWNMVCCTADLVYYLPDWLVCLHDLLGHNLNHHCWRGQEEMLRQELRLVVERWLMNMMISFFLNNVTTPIDILKTKMEASTASI